MARREAITDVLRTIEEESDEFRRLADERFAEELQLIGWCPSPLMGILNAAMDDLEPGEIYLEVGTYGGRSLTAALKDNEVQAHVIDPMALRTGKGEIFGGNMQEVFSGHELDINRPVKTDVDRWVAENQTKIESVTYTPWLNGQAIILYQR